jgi:hypothetical protein
MRLKLATKQKSILKTNQSLHTRKSLSFAASIEEICHFMKTESPKNISFIDPLYIQDSGDFSIKSISSSLLIPFWSIKEKAILSPRTYQYQVILDETVVKENILYISVLAKNIAYEKWITIRMTWDNWKTYQDVPATFQTTIGVSTDHYSGVDLFRAQFDMKQIQGNECQLEYAIRYNVLDQEYWDNNNQQNYKV